MHYSHVLFSYYRRQLIRWPSTLGSQVSRVDFMGKFLKLGFVLLLLPLQISSPGQASAHLGEHKSSQEMNYYQLPKIALSLSASPLLINGDADSLRYSASAKCSTDCKRIQYPNRRYKRQDNNNKRIELIRQISFSFSTVQSFGSPATQARV